ncbi:hypothetical protein ACLQ3C_12285 [Gordonia sp. DT30]|uniref:hypothetical protein n=1 Tax=unclassified Gordonia (in: high G+C Gram-positive bacteria) TaxID=2657482 RepID=UPI003CF4696F
MSEPTFAPLPGERVIYQTKFSPRLILKHLKVTVTLTDERVHISEPHTLFAIFPHGGYCNSVPLHAISDVAAGNTASSRAIMWGTLSIILGFVTLVLPVLFGSGGGFNAISVPFFLFFVVLGAVMLLAAHTVALRVRSGSQSRRPRGHCRLR